MNDANVCIPHEVSNALVEHSPAGFILFAINPQGSPEVIHFYDSDMAALALQNFVGLWSKAIHSNQSENMKIMFSDNQDEGEEETEDLEEL
jgi:hypothetical protein